MMLSSELMQHGRLKTPSATRCRHQRVAPQAGREPPAVTAAARKTLHIGRPPSRCRGYRRGVTDVPPGTARQSLVPRWAPKTPAATCQPPPPRHERRCIPGRLPATVTATDAVTDAARPTRRQERPACPCCPHRRAPQTRRYLPAGIDRRPETGRRGSGTTEALPPSGCLGRIVTASPPVVVSRSFHHRRGTNNAEPPTRWHVVAATNQPLPTDVHRRGKNNAAGPMRSYTPAAPAKAAPLMRRRGLPDTKATQPTGIHRRGLSDVAATTLARRIPTHDGLTADKIAATVAAVSPAVVPEVTIVDSAPPTQERKGPGARRTKPSLLRTIP